MTDIAAKSNNGYCKDPILKCLPEDPTVSLKQMTENLDIYRQKIWRRKTQLEKDNVIWGYTSVVDDTKLNNIVYLVLMKMKPLSEELVNVLMERMEDIRDNEQDVRILNMLFINGDYDWMLMMSAPDTAACRKHYDLLRNTYEDFLLEKPVMITVDFPLVREGKVNPEYHRLRDFLTP